MQPNLQQFQQKFNGRNSMRQQEKNLKQEITQPNLQQFQQELSGWNSMRQQEKNLKQEITQPNLQQFQQEFSGRNSCLCSCCLFATSAHSIALFKLHYNRNGLQTCYYNSLSVCLRLPLSSCLCSCSWLIYDHNALNCTLLRCHCRAQQTPNRTAKTHTKSVLKNHFGGSQNRRLHRNTKTTSCWRLTRVARCFTGLSLPPPPKTSVTDRRNEFIYRIIRHSNMNRYVKWIMIWKKGSSLRLSAKELNNCKKCFIIAHYHLDIRLQQLIWLALLV